MAEQTHEAQMLINYIPGEECRVAIVEDGKLEEYHVEKFASASRVGNIYVGRVANVEPAIQAAFVDFGVGENGFLHVSDLHPRYFPGESDDATERVGLKTPRRERPPIQACLRRGDEVIVQVLKEGVGTKGPTLTSYLSIPGRFLVMMPYMDKTGVSRKVEDEDQRRNMREILDQLELPEGFGFIVRTAGMDRTKTELKRDLAYLLRLWKDMEKRLASGNKPRMLYSESDLLVRALRDLLTPEITEVIIDHALALKRAGRFMKIVSPRGQAKLLQYPGGTPLFHAFSIEQQIALIHAREVPLPSGGRLVIDQTEALVAIDVNSGKSRESRDSETNAYQTNIEAVDEICRQLRLRDQGGIVVNDLIDMRHASHRKDIEARIKERLKRDRARTTVTPISEFGILELTRQRMRPSHESLHFVDCPTCRGRGMVQKPESIASDALRDLAAVLNLANVAKVEMAVAPRVAGELLSTKRQLLSRIERGSGKHVDVRVSESVAVDRVSFYAYDAQGADIDLATIPKPKRPKDLPEWVDPDADAHWATEPDEEKQADLEPIESEDEAAEAAIHPIELDAPANDDDVLGPDAVSRRGGGPAGGRGGLGGRDEQGTGEGGRRRRRRGRGRGRGGDEAPQQGGGRGAPAHSNARGPSQQRGSAPQRGPAPQHTSHAPMGLAGDHGDADDLGAPPATNDGEFSDQANDQGGPLDGAPVQGAPSGGEGAEQGEGGGRKRRRRRRGRGRGRGRDGQAQPGDGSHGEQQARPQDVEFSEPMTGDQARPSVRPSPRVRVDGPVTPALLAGDHGDNGDAPFGVPPPIPRGHGGDGVYAPFDGEPTNDRAEDSANEESSDQGVSGDHADHGDRTPGAAGEQDGEGVRRRRRRRRGRGGRGGGGGGGGSGGAGNSIPNENRNPPADRRPADGQPRHVRPEPQGQPRPQPRSQPRPQPAPPPIPRAEPKPQPKPAAAPGPRLLYGGARRKLNPSELNKRPKPE
jgi:ribonuclease E